jgi:hypothetical protein
MSRSPLPSTMMFYNLTGSYITTTQLVVSVPLVYAIYKISTFIYDEVTSPIRNVPGPPNPDFIYGNFKALSESVSPKLTTVSFLNAEGYFPNRIIPFCLSIGSTNTDQQSNSGGCSE